MNYRLASEIYGMKPWFVDQQTLPVLLGVLNDLRNNISFSEVETKNNTPFIFDFNNKTKIITRDWQLETDKNFEGIGVISLDGPIVKNGGASTIGMLEVSKMMRNMAVDKRVKGFIILTDSGGGSSAAVDIMRDAILDVKKNKSVIGLISKGGIACSAAYGILAACDAIYSEHEMNTVGSVGTMIQFDAQKANSENKVDGTTHIRLYASKSTHKNREFEEAVNNGNYSFLLNELLDPINEQFINTVISDRPSLNGSKYENGHTVFCKDGLGTFIDGIASFDEVVNMVLTVDKKNINTTTTTNNNKKLTKKNMTIEELKNEHPSTYNAVFNAGVTSGTELEKDRVGSWLAHSATDLEAVKNGIDSGKSISSTDREKFIIKSTSANALLNFKKDNAPDLTTPQSEFKDEKQENSTELEAFNKEVNQFIK